jgi:hypothetical protein
MSSPGVLEDQVLKVHTARDGRVWYVAGGHGAINAQVPIADFLDDAECCDTHHVRMVGSVDNAEALCLFYGRKRAGRLLRLEVANPAAIGRTRAERDDPRLMLVRMRDSAADGLNPAMGGWHEFTATDLPSYAIAANEAARGRELDRAHSRLEMLMNHPAWPGLSFIGHLEAHTLARLLGVILDPRWYMSLRTPRGSDVAPYYDDASKLHAYLGLDPRTMAGVLGLCPESGSAARCRLVLESWASFGPPAPERMQDPRCFLWRRYRRESGPVRGALRASQMFVDYLRLVWLDALYCDRTGLPAAPGKRPAREGLFAPDHFFARDDEAAAYDDHRVAVARLG